MRRALLVPGFHWLVVCFLLAGGAGAQSSTRLVRSGLSDYNHIPNAAKEVLEHADDFRLLSLSPARQLQPGKNDFHGYRILGQTSVPDTETRRRLVAALEHGVLENQGTIAACFNPRHGIRVVQKGRRADFVICFQCLQVEVYGEGAGEFLVSGSPQPVFDKVLSDARVPLE